MIQPTSGPQRSVLAQVLDGELRELGSPFADIRSEDGLLVVSDQVHLFDRGDLSDSRERVPDERVSRDLEERLQSEVVIVSRAKLYV